MSNCKCVIALSCSAHSFYIQRHNKKDIRQLIHEVVYPYNLMEGDQCTNAKYFNVLTTHNEVMNTK